MGPQVGVVWLATPTPLGHLSFTQPIRAQHHPVPGALFWMGRRLDQAKAAPSYNLPSGTEGVSEPCCGHSWTPSLQLQAAVSGMGADLSQNTETPTKLSGLLDQAVPEEGVITCPSQ